MASIEENLALNLKNLREQAGMTLEDLAAASKIGIGTLNKWENQRQGFRLNNLRTVAEALGCSIDDLTADPSSRPTRASLIAQIIDFIPQLTPPQLKQLVEEIEKITQRSKSK